MSKHSNKKPPSPLRRRMQPRSTTSFSRRGFLRQVGGAAAAFASTALLSQCDKKTREEFFQRHFHELSPGDLKQIIARLEQDYLKQWDKQVSVSTYPPLKDTLFGFALDITRCLGCRHCVYACVDENNQSRNPQIHWIKVLKMDRINSHGVHHAQAYYEHSRNPNEGKFYLPVSCQHCRRAPCVKVCPVEATWQEQDGIIVIDYNWCIGCRCCMAACPYGARHFNWGRPQIPKEKLKTQTHYLGNRPRMVGVCEKCTFCIQRTRKPNGQGRYPACVEVCPVGARKFGNLLDPTSPVRKVIETKRVFILKEELNTQPKFFYFYGA